MLKPPPDLSASLLVAINANWAWAVPPATRIIAVNAFGNVIFQDRDEAVWRICPEELACDRIAAELSEYKRMQASEDFCLD